MAVSTFVSAADLLDTLHGFQLLHAGPFKLCSRFLRESPSVNPQHLIQFALEQNILTPFQAEHVSAGSAQNLLLPPFVLLNNAGSGCAGQVYQARGQDDDERYIIKILARGTRAGTQQVAQTLRRFAAFRAPGMVPISHIGTVSERTYMVWPDASEGHTLEQLVQERGKLPPKEIVFYAIQACRALHTCHQEGLFHGLLKAADLQIDVDHKVLIKDLGMGFLLTLSREESTLDTMTSLGQLASGLDWASPESLMDQRDRTPLSDQYSLGCVLYYGLTGEVPFPVVSKVRKMLAHQTDEPIPLRELAPEVPVRLAAIVERLMSKVPAERYEGMGETEAAFRSLVSRPAVAAPKTIAKPAPTPARTAAPTAGEGPSEDASNPWIAWGVTLLAGLAACILGWLLLAS